jgi:hypothetical protein
MHNLKNALKTHNIKVGFSSSKDKTIVVFATSSTLNVKETPKSDQIIDSGALYHMSQDQHLFSSPYD